MIRYLKLSFLITICFSHDTLPSTQSDNVYKKVKRTNNLEDISMIKSHRNFNRTFTYSPLVSKIEDRLRRASRKQYEVVNMLWRKTNFFVDFDEKPTPKLPLKNRSISDKSLSTNSQENLHQLSSNLVPSTPSYIEFYYFDEIDGYLKRKDYSFHPNNKFMHSKIDKGLEKSNDIILRQPILTFNSRFIKETVKEPTMHYSEFNKQLNNYGDSKSNLSHTDIYKVHGELNSTHKFLGQILGKSNSNESQWLSIFFTDPLNRHREQTLTKNGIVSESTTAYDKIKFFEIYDSNTIATIKATVSGQYFDNGTETTKVNKNYNTQRHKLTDTELITRPPRILINKKRNVINGSYKKNKISQSTMKQPGPSIIVRSTVWSDYPYISVYIYEPLSIYCDAAAINTYWLIAAGSCLSRHRKNNLLNERSAYIAYCGDNWWEPESIAYVRRSLIHPLYQLRDKTRRYLYNIGAVQVITSLQNNCNGWRPVSLVAHKFPISEKGFPATALGWGLDKYNARYSYYDLPKHPLTVYKGTIFSKSCPGSLEYANGQYDTELNGRNIYCLSLPYEGGKNTSHGSLLLVEGKLIALSLQKGRGPENEMSVQYTAIWRLVPWIQALTLNTTKKLFARKKYPI